jgi:hypothetical protein
MEYLQLKKLKLVVQFIIDIFIDEVICRIERHYALKTHIEHIKSCFLISAAI